MKKNDTEKTEISQPLPSQEVPETPEVPQDTAVNETPRKAKATIPDFLKEYVDAYPHNRTFYVTSDRMVFLEGDRGLAVMHQSSLPGGENVETYKIK